MSDSKSENGKSAPNYSRGVLSEPTYSRSLSDTYVNQISVLKTLSNEQLINKNPRQFQINEIAELSGVKDEKEVQRYLFILEGQKLVAPYPAGDFTSRTWHITKRGIRAVRTINSTVH